jgi:glutathione S-transferase
MDYYSLPPSPFGMRAVLVAWAKGHELAITPPPGGLRSAQFRALNPLGKVPCLVDGDFVLPESAVIADYLDVTLPGAPLWPPHPRSRAKAMLVARLVDLSVGSSLVSAIRALRADKQETAQEGLRQVAEGLHGIEIFRDAADRWLVGDAFGHADAALMPFLCMADYFDAQFGTSALTTPHLGLRDWWQRARESELGRRLETHMVTAYDVALGPRTLSGSVD